MDDSSSQCSSLLHFTASWLQGCKSTCGRLKRQLCGQGTCPHSCFASTSAEWYGLYHHWLTPSGWGLLLVQAL